MKIRQTYLHDGQWLKLSESDGFEANTCQLVLVFGAKKPLKDPANAKEIRKEYPNAQIVFGSTAGEIISDSVYDDTIAVTAVYLAKSSITCAMANITEFENSFEAGNALIQKLKPEGLVNVLVIADGTKINGSELVTGLNHNKPPHARIVGGLAGDGDAFESTVVGLNDTLSEGLLVAVGFYGQIKSGSGSFGGWDEFGPIRTITRSHKNILYEIDGKNALGLYKTYLGPYAKELPGSAFFFPIAISVEGTDKKVVRTILTINEADQSMTFAGNMPEGSKLRLMKANFDRIIDASSGAANDSFIGLTDSEPELAILISCVGRKIILKERVFEEIEAAREVFGKSTVMTGFYSYGEISPLSTAGHCELHNQTMTITTLSEN